MRISDWSSDVCSSDLRHECKATVHQLDRTHVRFVKIGMTNHRLVEGDERQKQHGCLHFLDLAERGAGFKMRLAIEASANLQCRQRSKQGRSEEHTSELQSLMRISYAVFCLKKKKTHD